MSICAYPAPSPFPPSFEGSPWAYGFGLFGDIVAAALALAVLLTYMFEARRNREISKTLRNPIELPAIPKWSALYLYRLGKISILTFIVMRALPDAVWMLAWGEVSDPTIRFLLAVDLWFDGLAMYPFLLAMLCWAWGRQVIPQKLLEGNQAAVTGRVPWTLFWRNGRIIIAVVVIAVGVTIGKASG